MHKKSNRGAQFATISRNGHGHLEHRQITGSPDLNEWFAHDWPGIAQVFRLQRTVLVLKTEAIRQQEVVYGLRSLSLTQAPAGTMLANLRAHWAIENRLHWKRNVTLREDACQTRTGAVPSVLAQLNSAVLSLMDRAGVHNVARQRRRSAACFPQTVSLVLTGRCSVF